MKKIYSLLVLSFIIITLAPANAQTTDNYKVKQYFRLPQNIKEGDYMEKTVVLKIKKQYAGQCSQNNIQIADMVNYFTQIGATNIKRKFPTAQPPARDVNPLGLPYADLTRIYQFTYTADIPLETVINTLYAMNYSEYAEPNYIMKSFYTPSDPALSSQYHLTKISALQAWDISKGDTNTVIGIVDSEIEWDHIDLQTQVKLNYNDPIDGIDNDNDGFVDNFRGFDMGENDNDTRSSASPHGTHVSGCAAGGTDNGIGIAGPGFKCKILPVKISNSSGSLIAGYEGIQYAADHGVKVINCSWGSAGGGQAGQDVINYATINKDALVIAAAGNDGVQTEFFPAAYNYVISVAASTSQDKRAYFSNYGTWIDITAPGQSIYATWINDSYTYSDGTSMASPIAAGAAAIIRSHYPALNALQVGEQLKASCDPMFAETQYAAGKMGMGRINMFTAVSGLTAPSVVMTEKTIADYTSNDCNSDTISISATFVNYLLPTGNITATLSTTSSYVTILDGSSTLGTIATMGTANNNTDPFIIVVNPGAPINSKANFEITVTDGGYTTKAFISFTINVDYINVAINEVATSITSKSLIGFNDFSTQQEGVGFRYIPGDGENLLFDGGLMVGIPGKVSDHVRNGGAGIDEDFTSTKRIAKVETPEADFAVEGIFSDAPISSAALPVSVHHKAYAWNKPGHTRYVIVEYTLTNKGTNSLNNLYAGIFTDWDINMGDAQGYDNNKSATDIARKLGYTYNLETGGFYAGVQVVTDNGGFTHYGIDNDGSNGSVNIYTSYTTAEKYTTLTTMRATGGDPTGADPAGARDQSNVVSTGPFTITPGDSVTIAFAVLAGDNLVDLQKSADSAKVQYPGYLQTTPCVASVAVNEQNINDQVILGQNYPNPARSFTTINFSLPESENAKLSIYNVVGEKVYQTFVSGINAVVDINLTTFKNGMYYYSLETSEGIFTKKMTIVK